MLIEDNHHYGKIVSDILGLGGFHAELLPDDKIKYTEAEKKKGVK